MSRMLAIGVLAALCCAMVCSPLAGGGVARKAGLLAKGAAWATSRGPDTVTAFDGATGRVLATIPVGKAPMGLAVPRGTNKLYVGNEGSNSVSVISLTRREVITTINVGSRPHHMYASPDGSRVYLAEFGTNKIAVIDTMTDSLVAEWATGPPTERTHAPAPSPDGKTLYAVNSGGNTLAALDAKTGAIEWSMPTGDNPSEFHILRDGKTGYLSVRNLDEIDMIDLVARQVVRKIPVGDQPDTVQIAPDESFLVVALRATPAEVDVIDLRSFSVSKVVFTGVRLAGHNWLSANGRYSYVSLDDPGGVGVIDHGRTPSSESGRIQAAARCTGCSTTTHERPAAPGCRSGRVGPPLARTGLPESAWAAPKRRPRFAGELFGLRRGVEVSVRAGLGSVPARPLVWLSKCR
jgi:YVTN family beta-propeller protein